MEPDLFPAKPGADNEVVKAGLELGLLCFALRMNKNTLLPTALYEIPDTVEALADAFREHYLATRRPLYGDKPVH